MASIPSQTPAKKPFKLSTKALEQAISAEWESQKKFSAAAMPLTSLAFTAIDRVAGQEKAIVDALMEYIDTDALCYRSENLIDRQKKEWDPVLVWAGAKFNALWQTTTGITALEQPKALHQAVREYLLKLDAMHLAAACVLSPLLSSIALTLAVLEKHISAKDAFKLSRLEEEAQVEQWGRDEDAARRAQRLGEEVASAGQFLRLLGER